MDKRVLITHANCMDGIGCVVAVREYEKLTGLEECQVIYMNYGDDLEEISELDSSVSILMADFSLPALVLNELHKKHLGRVKVLDHHATAEEDLQDLDFCTFDMNKSGAVLTWEYLLPDEQVPALLRYIQDRDLWIWKLNDSKEVSAALQMIDKREIGVFMSYLKDVTGLVEQGKAILDYQNSQIDKIVSKKKKLNRTTIGDYKDIICINTTTLISEIGNALVEDEPFVAMYFIKDDKAIFSLRADGKVNVSEVAKTFDGGGHANAAGFSIELKDLYNFIYEQKPRRNDE